jgi:hypothetical protein
VRAHGCDRGYKAISRALKRLNEDRIIGRICKRLPKPHHCGIQAVVEIDEGIARPQSASELFPADGLARMIEQYLQNLTGLLLQPDLSALLPKFTGMKINLKNTKSKNSPWL